jgi:hypothetical protein
MKPKIIFVLLSALIGTVLYFVLSLLLAAIILAVTGEGPHGYGVFLYLVLPLYLTPIGLIAGLITSLLTKDLKYKRLILRLGMIFITVVGGVGLLLAVWKALNGE